MSKSISEIKIEFEQAGEQQWEALCQEYETDSRTGVKNLTARYRKKQQALVQERERLEVMKTFERKYADYSFICGIDEAGRGPLAGPVVAGAVILPKDCEILYLNDSKKLSAAKREELYDEIMEKAVAAAVGMASPARIDEINILQATYEAMREAISKLAVEPGILLNDAVTIPEMIIPQVPIIKGDAKSVSIAAASILAKEAKKYESSITISKGEKTVDVTRLMAVMGLCVVGLGLFGVSIIYVLTGNSSILFGFSLGASFVALFARVGGGIYTKGSI